MSAFITRMKESDYHHQRMAHRQFEFNIGRLSFQLWKTAKYCLCGRRKCKKFKKQEAFWKSCHNKIPRKRLTK